MNVAALKASLLLISRRWGIRVQGMINGKLSGASPSFAVERRRTERCRGDVPSDVEAMSRAVSRGDVPSGA